MRSPTRKHKGAVLAICLVCFSLVCLLTVNFFIALGMEQAAVALRQSLLERSYTVDQLGEEFLAGTLTDGAQVSGYSCQIQGAVLTVRDASGATVLVVEKDGSSILRWNRTPEVAP